MGFLKRLVGGGDPPAPEWAAFFTGAEYRHFLDVVVADLRRRGYDPQVGDGFVSADTGGEKPVQWGLANLAQRCNQEDPSRWEAIVATHFTALQQMVVIGHSQGGILTKLTAIDTGTRLWDRISARPFDAVQLTPETRKLLEQSMFFTPRSSHRSRS